MEDDLSFGFSCYYNKQFNEYLTELKNYNLIRLVGQGWNTVFTLKNITFTKETNTNWRSNAAYLITKKGINNVLNSVSITNNVYDFRKVNDTIIADIFIQSKAENTYNIPLFTLNFSHSINSTIRPDKLNWANDYLKEQKYIRTLWEKTI